MPKFKLLTVSLFVMSVSLPVTGHLVLVLVDTHTPAPVSRLSGVKGPGSPSTEVWTSLVLLPKLALDLLAGEASRSLATWSWNS